MITEVQYYTITYESIDGPHRIVRAELKKRATACPHCNSDKIVGFGRKPEKISDVPANGVPVVILLNRRRYRCKGCGKTFMEPVPNKSSNRQMSDALLSYVRNQARDFTQREIARMVGVHEKTIRMIIRDS